MAPPMSVRSTLLFLFAAFSALMLGLAAGAVWMVLALYLRHPLPWLAVPIAALLAWTIRGSVQRAGAAAMLLAAAATALAALYVNMLIAGVRIAGNMGLGIVDALRTAGIPKPVRSALATRAALGNTEVSRSSPVTWGESVGLTRATSLPASLRAATTLTC